MLPYPVRPQLARLEDTLPGKAGWVFEPKWDGFRCILFKRGREIFLQSRNGKDLSRSFPEIVRAAQSLPDCVLDGELVAIRDGRQDFESLLGRLSGDGREEVSLVLFDALWWDDCDLRHEEFSRRRTRLGQFGSTRLQTTPQTEDRETAERWLHDSFILGFEGVVAKQSALPYQSGERCLVKVKHFESVDVVVGGYTGQPGDPRGLVVGLYDDQGTLHHVGTTSVVSSAVRAAGAKLATSEVSFTGRQPGRSRWPSHQFDEWVPVEATTVCEIAFNRLDGTTFRHSVRFLRWRPDLDPRGCTFAQLERFRPVGR
jgi:ATP-dependent DNA ligase